MARTIVRSYTGKHAHAFIPELAKLRIRVFREFPYLYDGSMDYEENYLLRLADTPDSILVIAFDGREVVGASTGLPLVAETDNIREPWIRAGIDPAGIFYYGESVLLDAYRGRGIGVAFFGQREAWARRLGRFGLITFCAVVRPETHHLRPADYVPLDNFWKNRGFSRTSDKECTIAWKDVDQVVETPKKLHFWSKQIDGPAASPA